MRKRAPVDVNKGKKGRQSPPEGKGEGKSLEETEAECPEVLNNFL